MQELGELMIYRSAISKLADGEWKPEGKFSLGPLKPSLMGEDPRLPKMPEKPTLIDFFKLRFATVYDAMLATPMGPTDVALGETATPEHMRLRVEYDIYYIEHWSLWLDIKILFLTLFVGFVNENAY